MVGHVEDLRHHLRQEERKLELPLGGTPAALLVDASVTTRVHASYRTGTPQHMAQCHGTLSLD